MEVALEGKRLGFLGAGNIAEALIKGILNSHLLPPGRVWVTNRNNPERLAELRELYGIVPCPDKAELVAHTDVLFLVCKPKDVEELLTELTLRKGQLLISVAAGVSLATLQRLVGPGVDVVRCMPNTSAWVGESATVLAAPAARAAEAAAWLSAVGPVSFAPEACLDAVTGLAGTGPAYVYYLAEAMLAAGPKLGLTPELTRQLTVQTLKGAAAMLEATDHSPEHLRRQVTSPGGTTAAAMATLEAAQVKATLVAAIERATERSRELGLTSANPADILKR